jgi:hypothetical protein
MDASLLEAALIGFEQMRRNVEEKIADIPSVITQNRPLMIT